jgi:hypothetical protein
MECPMTQVEIAVLAFVVVMFVTFMLGLGIVSWRNDGHSS